MLGDVCANIHSIQTLGTLDGPGVRFVVFMQGCQLRCGCCHNPDTWKKEDGKVYSATQLSERALRYRSYFGEDGGVTLSGGEPLLQADFAASFFELCHQKGLNTCLDTSGSILDDSVKKLLSHTDRVLLDIKYHTDQLYRENVGCSIEAPLAFLEYLDKGAIAVTLRQVVIPGLSDSEENYAFLAELIKKHTCIECVELLPFKKICKVKYDKLGIPFRFDGYPEPSAQSVAERENSLNTIINER